MKKLMLILVVPLLLVSCTAIKSSGNNIAPGEVIIKASHEKPASLEDRNTIVINGLLEGEEYVEVIVKGEIFDFEQIALAWDESKNDLKEKEIVNRIERLENRTLVIKTYQPEGIPTEKIRWKSKSGKSYEYVISEKNLVDNDDNSVKIKLE